MAGCRADCERSDMTSFKQYRDYLADGENAGEIVNFINSISTNLTKFFRESHHFDHSFCNCGIGWPPEDAEHPMSGIRSPDDSLNDPMPAGISH